MYFTASWLQLFGMAPEFRMQGREFKYKNHNREKDK